MAKVRLLREGGTTRKYEEGDVLDLGGIKVDRQGFLDRMNDLSGLDEWFSSHEGFRGSKIRSRVARRINEMGEAILKGSMQKGELAKLISDNPDFASTGRTRRRVFTGNYNSKDENTVNALAARYLLDTLNSSEYKEEKKEEKPKEELPMYSFDLASGLLGTDEGRRAAAISGITRFTDPSERFNAVMGQYNNYLSTIARDRESGKYNAESDWSPYDRYQGALQYLTDYDTYMKNRSALAGAIGMADFGVLSNLIEGTQQQEGTQQTQEKTPEQAAAEENERLNKEIALRQMQEQNNQLRFNLESEDAYKDYMRDFQYDPKKLYGIYGSDYARARDEVSNDQWFRTVKARDLLDYSSKSAQQKQKELIAEISNLYNNYQRNVRGNMGRVGADMDDINKFWNSAFSGDTMLASYKSPDNLSAAGKTNASQMMRLEDALMQIGYKSGPIDDTYSAADHTMLFMTNKGLRRMSLKQAVNEGYLTDEKAKEIFQYGYKAAKDAGFHKQGGVIKAQIGVKTPNLSDQYILNTQPRQMDERVRKQMEEEKTAKQRTFKAPGPSTKGGKPVDDDVRNAALTSAALNLVGAIVGLTGASPIAGGIGLAGSAAQAYSDYNNPNLTAGEATWNILGNLGLDAISLIPFAGTAATASKTVKAAKGLLKFINATSIANGVYNLGENGEIILHGLNRIVNDGIGSMSKQELTDLANAVSGVAGLTTAGASMARNRGRMKRYVNKSAHDIPVIRQDGSKARVRVSEEEYNKIAKMTKPQRDEHITKNYGKEGETLTVDADNMRVAGEKPKWYRVDRRLGNAYHRYTDMFDPVYGGRNNYYAFNRPEGYDDLIGLKRFARYATNRDARIALGNNDIPVINRPRPKQNEAPAEKSNSGTDSPTQKPEQDKDKPAQKPAASEKHVSNFNEYTPARYVSPSPSYQGTGQQENSYRDIAKTVEEIRSQTAGKERKPLITTDDNQNQGRSFIIPGVNDNNTGKELIVPEFMKRNNPNWQVVKDAKGRNSITIGSDTFLRLKNGNIYNATQRRPASVQEKKFIERNVENSGIKFKDGGVLRFQRGGIRNVTNIPELNNSYQSYLSSWTDSTGREILEALQALDNIRKTQGEGAFLKAREEFMKRNGLQDTYKTGVDAQGDYGWFKESLNPFEAVGTHQDNFNTMTGKANQYIDQYSGLVGRGGSSDKAAQNWKADNLQGSKTALRTEGYSMDDTDEMFRNSERVKEIMNLSSQLGMRYDKLGISGGGNNYYGWSLAEAAPIEQPKASIPIPEADLDPGKIDVNNGFRPAGSSASPAASRTETNPASLGSGEGDGGGSKGGSGIDVAGVISSNLLGNLDPIISTMMNRRATKDTQKAIKPTLASSYRTYRPVENDYFAKASADKNAAALKSAGYRMANSTADAALGHASYLSALSKAAGIKFGGDKISNDRFYTTRDLAMQEENANVARNTAVANSNMDAMNRAAYMRAMVGINGRMQNWTGVWQPWMREKRGMAMQNEAIQKAKDLALFNLEYQKRLNEGTPQFETSEEAIAYYSSPEYKRKSEQIARLAIQNNPQYRTTAIFGRRGAKIKTSFEVNLGLDEFSKEFFRNERAAMADRTKRLRDSGAGALSFAKINNSSIINLNKNLKYAKTVVKKR